MQPNIKTARCANPHDAISTIINRNRNRSAGKHAFKAESLVEIVRAGLLSPGGARAFSVADGLKSYARGLPMFQEGAK